MSIVFSVVWFMVWWLLIGLGVTIFVIVIKKISKDPPPSKEVKLFTVCLGPFSLVLVLFGTLLKAFGYESDDFESK